MGKGTRGIRTQHGGHKRSGKGGGSGFWGGREDAKDYSNRARRFEDDQAVAEGYDEACEHTQTRWLRDNVYTCTSCHEEIVKEDQS